MAELSVTETHSMKYDGSQHYRYAVTEMQRTDDALWVYTPPGVLVMSYRGGGLTRYHGLHLFFVDRYYNMLVQWHADWQPRMHYVNIATPARWDDGAVRWVDLDIDLIWRSTSDVVLTDDEDEFADHQVRFAYPAALIAAVERSADDVREQFVRRAPLFDGSLYRWRPT